MKQIYKKYKSGKGFTLLEMLIVVAILVILMGIGIVSLITVRKNLRQKQLDYMAELVYMAAQNNLVNLSVDTGNYNLYKYDPEGVDVKQLGYVPTGTVQIELEDSVYPTSDSLCYVCSWTDVESNVAKTLVPSNLLSAEVWQGDWVIEYAPDEAFVYAVYYSEASETSRVRYYDTDESNPFYEYLRDKVNRLKDGAQVGYYGGDVAVNLHDRVLEPDISIHNGDMLIAYISCASLDGKEVSFDITVSDGNKSYTIPNAKKDTQKVGNRYVCKVILDSLDHPFWSQCSTLTPGADITIEASVSCASKFIDGSTVTGKTNSLYASVDDGVAQISCARHLQNLDESAFKGHTDAQEKITAAEQTGDISFRDDGVTALTNDQEEWYTLYGDRDFSPINNDYLTSYDGEDHSITGLHMQGDSDEASGLFGTVTLSSARSLAISNVTLSGVRIDTGKYTGALVGNTTGSGKCTIENCYSILEKSTDLKGKDSTYVWLDGTRVGGLVGYITSNSTVEIISSCAASVVGSDSAQAAGGLVGYCTGSLTVEGSYADCYLSGKYTGGLVGYGTNFSSTGKISRSISNSYAAGYQTASGGAAGLVYGPVTNLSNSYTVCWYSNMKDTVNKYATVTKILGSLSRVYYMAGYPTGTSTTDDDANTTYGRQLGYEELCGNTTFKLDDGTQAWLVDELNETDTSDGNSSSSKTFTSLPKENTVAYNLQDQALSNYVYPSLSLAHYGDWNASFDNGGLVYYEVYDAKTPNNLGIYGANMNTLSDENTVLGDGYGVVYLQADFNKINKLTFTTDADGEKTVDLGTAIEFSGSNNVTYVLIPLPTTLTNTDTAPDAFWQKLTVKRDGNVADTFYYNPHFAKTVETALNLDEGESPDAPSEVSIRTARQLYNLSLYYADYQYSSSGNTNSTVYDFVQELDIDYSSYNWPDYANHIDISSQYPIGWTGSAYVAFLGEYNGGCHTIQGVSFNNGTYTGFVAQNGGRLTNIVLTAEYADNRVLSFDQSSVSDGCCIGVLAAQNLSGGSISNCAVAGYSIKVNAVRDSSVYVGGLVGYNQGSILSSSAECPLISLTINNSNVLAGGFVGRNGGSISFCYTISDINVLKNDNTTSKTVVLAGFCAQNGPTLLNSYCGTSFTVNDDSSSLVYNFAPQSKTGQTLNSCYYLNGGTFRFTGSSHSYSENNTQTGSGEEAGYLSLSGEIENPVTIENFGTATASYFCENTTSWDGSTSFPFPTSVKNASGRYVHYGDWITGVSNASAGVFYWEYEDVGNEGEYHISFTFDDTNLCAVHDDGGEITYYGYGYYTKNSKIDDEDVSFADATGFNTIDKSRTKKCEVYINGETVNVNEMLRELMPGYTFHAYVTGTEDGQLYLTNAKQNGTWTLKTKDDDGNWQNYATYTVCPFFANAMSLSSDAAPGSEKRPYQIRSVAQLQYINWNYSSKSCKTDVTSSNYTYYPYLQYATVTGEGMQNFEDVNDKRPVQYWIQTHDIGDIGDSNDNGDTDFWPIAGTSTGSKDVYALMYYNGAFNAVLYNWFGGSYDGGSYKMINLHISSKLNNVAVFGYTCGADMHNIILYSNHGTVIERIPSDATDTIEHGYSNSETVLRNSICSYTIGGLVGIAYDYMYDEDGNAIDRSTNNANTISNCAIAGYTIQDTSQNSRISCGDVNIGGLFGVANANILNCSAVVDIVVDCTFEYIAACGNTVRAGGIAGCCPYKLENCYSGGSISLGENALYSIQGPDSARPKVHVGYNVLEKESTGELHFTHYYFAGICAGNFGGNFMNFTNVGYVGTFNAIYFADDAREIYGKDIVQTFSNCYTYMEMMDKAEIYEYTDTEYHYSACCIGLMDTLAIGGVPERVDQNGNLYTLFKSYKQKGLIFTIVDYPATDGHVTIDNCYYLNSCVTDSQYRNANIDETDYILGVRYVDESNSTYSDTAGEPNSLRKSGSMTLAEMSDGTLQEKLKDAGFAAVTTYENNNSQYVGSKYSFPGENKTLLGTVYPFPTIVTQTNAYNETVHVHYGNWTTGSLMFKEYYVSTDILKDGNTVDLNLKMQGDLSNKVAPELNFKDENGNSLEEGIITLAVTGKSNPYYDSNTGYWVYTLQLNETGVFLVETESLDNNTAKCQITVTGGFEISAKAVNVTHGQDLKGFSGYVNERCCVSLSANYTSNEGTTVDLLNSPNASNIQWTISYKGYEDIVEYENSGSEPYTDETAVRKITFSDSDNTSITGTVFKLLSEGNAIVQVTAKYCPDGWNGSEAKGLVFTAECAFEISVWSKTVIGIANTSDPANPTYNEITHQEPDVGAMEGKNGSYFSTAPQLEDETLFLYCSGTKAELADFLNNVKSANVTVNDEESSTSYTLILPTADEIVTFGDYQVAPLRLNHGGDGLNSYTISLAFEKKAFYLVNGVETSKDQVYNLSVKYEETGYTKLAVYFVAYTNNEEDNEEFELTSMSVPYGKSVESQFTTEVQLPNSPTYYKWADNSPWVATHDSKINTASELTRDTVFAKEIIGQTYTFLFYRSKGDIKDTDSITDTSENHEKRYAVYQVTYGGNGQALPYYKELSINQDSDEFYGWQVMKSGESGWNPVDDGLTIDEDGAILSDVLVTLDSLIKQGQTEFRLLAIITSPTEGSQSGQNNGESAEADSPSAEAAESETTEEPASEETPVVEAAEETPEAEAAEEPSSEETAETENSAEDAVLPEEESEPTLESVS